jgi:hypothetical protein
MPYVTSIERLAKEEGREEGREEGKREGLLAGIETSLGLKFGEGGLALMSAIRRVKHIAKLEALLKEIPDLPSVKAVKERIGKKA